MFVRVLESYADTSNAPLDPTSGTEGREEACRSRPAFDPARSYFVHSAQRCPATGAGFVLLVDQARQLHWVDDRHVRVVWEDRAEGDSGPSDVELPIRTPQSGPYTA